MADADADLDSAWRQLERDYYALLGLPRDASSDEVRGRFKTLSREFHPDRQRRGRPLASEDDDALVAAANSQYTALDRAYKVLSDPIKRAAYDQFGERGLLALEREDVALELARLPTTFAATTALTTTTTASAATAKEEVQRVVARALRRMNEQALEARFSSFSEMSMAVDASDLVREPMRGLRGLLRGGVRLVARTDMTIHQRTSFPLSASDTLTVGGYMFDKQGLGLGSLTLQLAHAAAEPTAPSVTLSTELGWTPKLHCQLSQPVSRRTTVVFVPELDAQGLDVSVGVNRVLAAELHGSMMWSSRDGLSGSLSHDAGSQSAAAAVAVGRRGPTASLSLRRGLAHASNVKLALKGSLLAGLSLVAGASHEISDRTRLAVGVLLARAGVTLRLGFTRGSVRFVMPVFLAPLAPQSAAATFVAATAPFVAAAAVEQLVRPARERRRRRAVEQRRAARLQLLAAARSAATAQQKLMARSAEDKRAQEAQRHDGKGLVVLLARYGRNPTSPDPLPPRDELSDALDALRTRYANGDGDADGDGDDDGDGDGDELEARADVTSDPSGGREDAREPQWVDVTTPLQFFVQDGALALPATSKAGLLGFYNPCVSRQESVADAVQGQVSTEQPLLYVRYAFDGLVFEATFDDEQAVALPSRFAQAMGPVGGVF